MPQQILADDAPLSNAVSHIPTKGRREEDGEGEEDGKDDETLLMTICSERNLGLSTLTACTASLAVTVGVAYGDIALAVAGVMALSYAFARYKTLSAKMEENRENCTDGLTM